MRITPVLYLRRKHDNWQYGLTDEGAVNRFPNFGYFDRMERRLTSIIAADLVGYSRLMEADEEGVIARLRNARANVIDPAVAEYGGRVIKTMGDGLLMEFPSAVAAVRAALKVQKKMQAQETGPDTERLRFRVGINVGDVILDGEDVLGDAVNVASRLEHLAIPGGITISDAVHDHLRGRLDVEFRDGGSRELRNIKHPTHVWFWPPEGEPAAKKPLPPPPDKPSIVVLPFDNMSGDPDQDYIADGVVEALTAALSRIRSFFVIARNSAFTYKGAARNIIEVGKELGVTYVLEGSIQRSGNRVRITVQLVESSAGFHIWAEKYDGLVDDIFDLQDRIAEQVAGAIQPSIRLAEVERTVRKPPQDLGAYEYAMRAMRHVWMLNEEDATLALEYLQKSLEADPDYPLALALTAWCNAQFAVYNWSTDHAGMLGKAMRFAELAARGSDDDPLVLTVLGTVQSLAHHQETARLILERALALDPNSAWTWSRLAWVDVYSDNGERALGNFEKALRLSPLDPMNFNNHVGIGAALLSLGRYEESVAEFHRGLRERPSANWIRRPMMTALSGAGRLSEARDMLQQIIERQPDFTIARYLEVMPFPPRMKSICAELLHAVELPER